jgi:hypothetical protein
MTEFCMVAPKTCGSLVCNFISPSWCPEFWGEFWILGGFVDSIVKWRNWQSHITLQNSDVALFIPVFLNS